MSRRALLLAGAVTGCIALLGFSAELVRHEFVRDPVSANFVTLTLAIGIASLIVGAAIGIRVPASATGPLLVAAGVGAAIGYTRFSVDRWLAVVGFVVAAATALLPHARRGRARRRRVAPGACRTRRRARRRSPCSVC